MEKELWPHRHGEEEQRGHGLSMEQKPRYCQKAMNEREGYGMSSDQTLQEIWILF